MAAPPPQAPPAVIPHAIELSYDAPDFSAPAVVVKVGQPPKVYHVNEKVLCASSEYAVTALKPAWTQGKGRVVTLSEDDPQLFNLYVNWLYGGKISVKAKEEEKMAGRPTSVFQVLFGLYALGDKLLDPSFKDAVSDALAATTGGTDKFHTIWLPHAGNVETLYNNTTSASTVRQLVATQYATCSNLDKLLQNHENVSFLRDVALARGKYSHATLKAAVAACKFHEHAPGKENCYRTKRAWP